MIRRIFYLLLVTVLLGGLGAVIAWWSFYQLPAFIAESIKNSPRPVMTVSAEEARSDTWQPEIAGIGTLVASEGIDIAPQVDGVVEEIFFDSSQDVKQGDKLIQLDTDTDSADLKNFRVQLANAEAELARRDRIFKKGFAAKADLESATAARDQLLASIERTEALIKQKTILAPWSGRVGLRTISPGSYIAPGQKIVWLQKIDPIFADFTVTEADYGRIVMGQKVNATFNAWPGKIYVGEVTTTDARISGDTRMITVRASLDNPEGKLLPGMYANVNVVAGEPQEVVTVPQTAVTFSLYGDNVFVVVKAKTPDPNNKDEQLEVERRFVKAGPARDGRVEIVSGIKPGERVVTAGHNKIDQGSPVKIDNSIALRAADTATIQ